MIGVLAIALLQAGGPTVGDTVWLEARVPVTTRQILRPQAWDLGDLGQVLGPADVRYFGDSATVRYPVVFWYPGTHAVSLPGPIVVSPEGRSDTLPARPLMIPIRSVLPAAVPRDSLAPKPAAELVRQAERSWFPVAMAAGLLVLLGVGAAAGVIRRRRPVVLPEPAVPPAEDPVSLLDRWAAMGETRAALEGWRQLIEARLVGADAAARTAVEPLLLALGTIGFRPDTPPADVDRLISAARRWMTEGR